jgi:hypothetical protein
MEAAVKQAQSKAHEVKQEVQQKVDEIKDNA